MGVCFMFDNDFLNSIYNLISSNDDYYDNCIKLKSQKNFSTLWICNIAVIRFYENNNDNIIAVADSFLEMFNLDSDNFKIKEGQAWTTINFNYETQNRIIENIESVFNKCYKESATDIFGCCSRYEQCSDEMKCVHPDKEHARGCMYKVNLDNGKIFYGKNRNI